MLVVLTLISPTNVWGNVTVAFADTSYTKCGNTQDVDETNCNGLNVPLTCGGESVTYWRENVASSDAWLTRDEVCQHIIDTCSGGLCDESTNFYFKALDSTVTCTAGYYGNDNSTTCELGCPKGSYCPGGNYNPLDLGNSKQPCPKGTYCPSTKLSSPMNCYNGMYQSSSGQSNCSTCPSGKYTTSENKPNESCLSCPNGTYSTSKANACSNCTNKPAAASYIYYSAYDTPGPATSNNCSWYLKCSGNQKYDETTKTCKNCDAGFHGTIDWSNIGVCYISTKGHYVCNPDNYRQIQNGQVTYGQATTCTANEYTMIIKAEYKKDGKTETKTINTTATLTYNNNPSQTIYTVYSGTQILNPTINDLNKGLNDSNTDKYYAPTSTGQAYLEINGTSYSLQSNYSGGSSGNWTMNANDHNALANLGNGATINLVLKIQSRPYKVYIATSAMAPNTTSPSDEFNIYTTPIATKHFGDTPSTDVSPDTSKTTLCSYTTNNVTNTNYGYIATSTKAKYYECTGTTLATLVTNTNNGSTAMFEPSKNDNNICVAYTMTICDAGYKCNSCSRSACDNGTYQNASGQSGCSDCAAGTFAPDDNKPHTSCTTCTAGTYSKEKASKCKTCDAGTYSGANASKCEPCGAGTYSKEEASKCETCPAGTYQPREAQPHCISCQDENTTTTKATTGLFTSDKTTGQESRKKCYINPKIKLADKFNPNGVTILDNENFEKIFWRGNNPSNSN